MDVIEVEPQTLWRKDRNTGALRLDDPAFDRVAALPQAKVVHGIGAAVGGTIPPPPADVDLFHESCQRIGAEWASEHLSFNRIELGGKETWTGFLLPPRQTQEGVAAAVHSIRVLSQGFGVPFAVETGVNYTRPRSDEMDDGAFVAEVVRQADCGILLDLHNLWCNERNGRQTVARFLDQIPLDRVVEVHVAGGLEVDGYWLDAHSSVPPVPVLEALRKLVPRLPNLKAVVLEVLPERLPRVGLGAMRETIRAIRSACQDGACAPLSRPSEPSDEEVRPSRAPGPLPAQWELELGLATLGRHAPGHELFAGDSAVTLYPKLARSFRGAAVSTSLPLTCRLLTLALGRDGLVRLLHGFWSVTDPDPFAAAEAEAFAKVLQRERPAVNHLLDVLAFEQAILATLDDGHARRVQFAADAELVLTAIEAGQVPNVANTKDRHVDVDAATAQAWAQSRVVPIPRS